MGKSTNQSATRKLSRAQVAKVLGVQDHEVAAMDGRQLHPTRSSSRAWQYDADEVGAVLHKKGETQTRSKSVTEPDGASTAAVFALFEARKSLPKVVVATQQPVSVVVDLRNQYDEMRGSITITPSGVRRLRAMLGQDFHNIRELFSAVRRALDARLEEGRADCLEFGEVLDPATGQLRPVAPKKAAADAIANKDQGEEHGEE